jgi:putative transposase
VGDSQAPTASTKNPTIVSLDPGVRTFMTVYDPSNEHVYEWGKQDISRIHRLCRHMDTLQSDIDKLKNATPDSKEHAQKRRRSLYNMRKAWKRIIARIQNIINELHKKLTCWLCLHYDVILLPRFETSQMVLKSKRRINSKTARNMLTWAHYRFRMRLKQKASAGLSVQVVDVTEEYTSKTCGLCGKINQKLGGNKHFLCNACGYDVDRDHNGARNILIKFLSDTF